MMIGGVDDQYFNLLKYSRKSIHLKTHWLFHAYSMLIPCQLGNGPERGMPVDPLTADPGGLGLPPIVSP